MVPKAVDRYTAATKKPCKVTVDSENFLSEDKVGGVVLLTRGGKIKVNKAEMGFSVLV